MLRDISPLGVVTYPEQVTASVSGFEMVTDLTALRTLSGYTTHAFAGLTAPLPGEGKVYYYDALSTATDDNIDVIKPSDLGGGEAGRWRLFLG